MSDSSSLDSSSLSSSFSFSSTILSFFEDIEAKLSVICVRKKVNFDLDDTSKNDNIVEEKEVMTYNISDNDNTSTPAWISALKNTRDNRK